MEYFTFQTMPLPGNYVAVALVLAAVVLLMFFAVGFVMGRRDSGSGPHGDALNFRKSASNDQQIMQLRERIEQLDALNNRYLNFVLNVPSVVTQLNSTMKSEEIISTICRLVGDIVVTETVDFYVYSREDDCLKRVDVSGRLREDQMCRMGEGLVGRAAKDLMIRMKGHGEAGPERTGEASPEGNLWMAVPVHFNKRLLGVIGIGRVKQFTGEERNLLKMIADVAAVTLVNRASIGEARQEAITDPLTGLHNRRYFFDQARLYVEQSILKGSPLSVFLFDIDNFKVYNDTNGHDEGDRLLKELSRVMREATRKGNVIARYGGEEFIVMLPGSSKEDAFLYANRLREKIAGHPFLHRGKQPLGIVSISGGVASYPSDGSSVQEVIRLADAALYKAKKEGRNRVEMHKPFMFSDLSKEEEEMLEPPV